jgi:hypothetical protein
MEAFGRLAFVLDREGYCGRNVSVAHKSYWIGLTDALDRKILLKRDCQLSPCSWSILSRILRQQKSHWSLLTSLSPMDLPPFSCSKRRNICEVLELMVFSSIYIIVDNFELNFYILYRCIRLAAYSSNCSLHQLLGGLNHAPITSF